MHDEKWLRELWQMDKINTGSSESETWDSKKIGAWSFVQLFRAKGPSFEGKKEKCFPDVKQLS